VGEPCLEGKKRRSIMKSKLLLPLLLFSLFFGCEKDDSITGPADSPTKENLAKFQIVQVDYDSLLIKSDNDIILPKKAVERIFFGQKVNGVFTANDSLEPEYLPTNDSYYLDFQFEKKVDRSLSVYEYTLRFLSVNGDFIDVDTTAQMYKYPYQSAEIFLTFDQVFPIEYLFQDFDLNDNYLFVHPLGPSGLYKYDLFSGQTEELLLYPSGDCLAADSIYVFCDVDHVKIYRYNLVTDKTDLELDLSGLTYSLIKGLDIYQGILYALFESSPSYFLAKFDFEGKYLGQIEYPKTTMYMAISNGILYSIEF
jgi:hypothetical protein